MSLLTKEQKEVFDKARATLSTPHTKYETAVIAKELFYIIDDLQAKYSTDKELPDTFYRVLTPKIDRYQQGDKILDDEPEWVPVDELWIGQHVLENVVSIRPEARRKQYTEQELYDKWFNLGEEAPCEYDTLEACARFLGALKAEP